MARKRMFDNEIISQDSFLDLPLEAKALYFLLGMEADDEGFVAPKKVLRLHGGTEDSIRILAAKNFIIPFKTGVVVITDWQKNNWLDSRRMQPTIYQNEKSLLSVNENKRYIVTNATDCKCLASAKQMLRENRVEENSIEENSSSSVNNILCDSNAEQLQHVILETLGTTNINNIKECIGYLDKLPFELIEYALRKTARVEKPSWQYTIPILESYIRNGFKTINEVKADDLKHKSKNSIKQKSPEKESLENYEQFYANKESENNGKDNR